MTSGFGAEKADPTVIAVMMAILLFCYGAGVVDAADDEGTSNEDLEMTAGQNVADIMRTIRLLRRENAELRQDKDKWLGEVVKLRKRLSLRCPCPEETAESSTGGRWKAWKAWFSSGSRARPNDGQNDGQSAQAPDSGFRWMWRSTFHRVRRSVTDFLAATATVTGTSLRIVATIFWLCVSFIGTNVLCLMWLKAAKIWTGCKAAVNWYFHLPLWVVLRQAAGQLAKLLGRLQWESESEKGDGNLKQEMKNLKKALSDLQQASRSRKQSSTDTVSGHNRDGSKSPRASFPPKRSHDTQRKKMCKRCHGEDHPIWACPARPEKPNAPCPVCRRGMHWKDQCPNRPRDMAYAASTCPGSEPDEEFSFRSGRSSPRGTGPKEDEGCSYHAAPSTCKEMKKGAKKPLLHVQGRISGEDRLRDFLVDSGSSANLISRRVCEETGQSAVPCEVSEVFGVSGEGLQVLGQATLPTRVGESEQMVSYLVVPQLRKTILGTPALSQFEFSINCHEEYLERPTGERIFCHATTTSPVQKNE